MNIKTHCVYPPIPIRAFDWSAIDDDTYDGPGSPVGWGRTPSMAVYDLLQNRLGLEWDYNLQGGQLGVRWARRWYREASGTIVEF